MDQNKKIKLTAINYKIAPNCMHCSYGKFANYNSIWGTCKKHIYFHLKHKEERELSINRDGFCPHFNEDKSKEFYLEGFSSFRNY